VIFKDNALNGPMSIPWSNFGGTFDPTSTVGVTSGTCISVPSLPAFQLIQISYSINSSPFPSSWYTSLSLDIRCATGTYNTLLVMWGQSDGSTTTKLPLSTYLPGGGPVTTTWKTAVIPLADFGATLPIR
jgi:hypothetical protein